MPEVLKNIIPEVLNRLSAGKPEQQTGLIRRWRAAVDGKTRKHTMIVGLRGGKLLINVDSPAWLFQLSLKKNQILKNLQEDFPELMAISFKIGKVN